MANSSYYYSAYTADQAFRNAYPAFAGTAARSFDPQPSYRAPRASRPAYRQPAARPEFQPRIQAQPGYGRSAATEVLSSTFMVLVRLAAVAMVLFAVVFIGRIALNSATVNSMLEANDISADISIARSVGNTLEMEESTLASPARIKAKAKSMKMYDPEYAEVIVLPQDVVCVDETGSLSMALSSQRVAGIAG